MPARPGEAHGKAEPIKDPLLARVSHLQEPSSKELTKEESTDLSAVGSPAGRTTLEEAKRKGLVGFLQLLGPGLITGASDDDPSGIGTYAQVGSQFGFGMLWTALFTFPVMAAVQELCARIARGAGREPPAKVPRLARRPCSAC